MKFMLTFIVLSIINVIFSTVRSIVTIKGNKLSAIEPELRTDGQLELKRARHPLIDPKKCGKRNSQSL